MSDVNFQGEVKQEDIILDFIFLGGILCVWRRISDIRCVGNVLLIKDAIPIDKGGYGMNVV